MQKSGLSLLRALLCVGPALWTCLQAIMQAAAALQQPTMVARGLRPVGRPRPCSILRAGRLAAVGRPARVGRVQHKAVASAEALEVRIGGSRAWKQCPAANAGCQTGSHGLQARAHGQSHSLLAATPRALPVRQRCFPYEKKMDGMQAALAGLPAAGVYLLGAALAAGLGGAGFAGAQALAPGALLVGGATAMVDQPGQGGAGARSGTGCLHRSPPGAAPRQPAAAACAAALCA